jgi:hypothetical protein
VRTEPTIVVLAFCANTFSGHAKNSTRMVKSIWLKAEEFCKDLFIYLDLLLIMREDIKDPKKTITIRRNYNTILLTLSTSGTNRWTIPTIKWTILSSILILM